MPTLKTGADCCGCTACASICGKNAITMQPDAMGFKYPVVNPDLCVECGMCERVCEFKEDYSTVGNFETPTPIGVRQKDMRELMKSRSGGAFASFSNWILDKGGVVYGAGYKGHFEVAHCRAVSKEERDVMRGSKYVQSNLDGVFREVRKDLLAGKWVLFSGTPCQTSGLKSFIPAKLQDKLLVVDIVCHGVPSPFVWRDFLKYMEQKNGEKVTAVNFRDKEKYGWKNQYETLTFEDGTQISGNAYAFLFYNNLMLRDSCANCYFSNVRRPSDLTLADFWGYEKTDEAFNVDNCGASLVLVSSAKGKMVFDEVSGDFEMIFPRMEDCMQTHLRRPVEMNPKCGEFTADYVSRGFEYVLNKYGNQNLRYRFRQLLVKTIIRVKKLMGLYHD